MDEITKFAREAGISERFDIEYTKDLGDPPHPGAGGLWGTTTFTRPMELRDLARFAAMIRADERERCAKVCEKQAERWRFAAASGQHYAASECAAAIRSGGGD